MSKATKQKNSFISKGEKYFIGVESDNSFINEVNNLYRFDYKKEGTEYGNIYIEYHDEPGNGNDYVKIGQTTCMSRRLGQNNGECSTGIWKPFGWVITRNYKEHEEQIITFLKNNYKLNERDKKKEQFLAKHDDCKFMFNAIKAICGDDLIGIVNIVDEPQY